MVEAAILILVIPLSFQMEKTGQVNGWGPPYFQSESHPQCINVEPKLVMILEWKFLIDSHFYRIGNLRIFRYIANCKVLNLTSLTCFFFYTDTKVVWEIFIGIYSKSMVCNT